MPLSDRLCFIAIALVGLLVFTAGVSAAGDPKEVDAILSAAESVFQSMERRDLPVLWKGLSSATRQSIIRNVYKAVGKAGITCSAEEIRAEFEKGGAIAQEYWGGYLSRFEPRSVLEQSRWSLGPVQKGRAAIILRYKKSDNDARIQMFLEEGAWKVGLDETFSTRK